MQWKSSYFSLSYWVCDSVAFLKSPSSFSLYYFCFMWCSSSKCQIVHWRQGHKNECHPPATKSDFDHKLSNLKRDVSFYSNFEDETGLESKSAASPHHESNFVDSTEELILKCNPKVYHNAENSSDSPDTGFTGFSASSMSNESSDDVSTCDSISSIDSGKSDDVAKNKTGSSAENVDPANTVSPKFVGLVDSSDSSGLRELNHRNPAFYAGQNQSRAAGPSNLGDKSMQDASVIDPPTKSAFFCKVALDPAELTAQPCHPAASVNPNRNRVNNLSNLGLNCSAISSGSNISGQTLLHDPLPNEMGNSESNSRLLKTERSWKMRCDSACSSDLSTSVEPGSSISLRVNIPSGSQRDAPSSESLCNSLAGGCRRYLNIVMALTILL